MAKFESQKRFTIKRKWEKARTTLFHHPHPPLTNTHTRRGHYSCTTCEWFLKCQEGQCDFIIAIISYLKIRIPFTNSVLFSLMVCVECHTDAVWTCTALRIHHNVGSWHSPNVACRDLCKIFTIKTRPRLLKLFINNKNCLFYYLVCSNGVTENWLLHVLYFRHFPHWFIICHVRAGDCVKTHFSSLDAILNCLTPGTSKHHKKIK